MISHPEGLFFFHGRDSKSNLFNEVHRGAGLIPQRPVVLPRRRVVQEEWSLRWLHRKT
jgi:hypothetical protein